MCGASDNRAAQVSLTLALSRWRARELRQKIRKDPGSLRFGRDDGKELGMTQKSEPQLEDASNIRGPLGRAMQPGQAGGACPCVLCAEHRYRSFGGVWVSGDSPLEQICAGILDLDVADQRGDDRLFDAL